MSILIINPNSTQAMTASMLAAARSAAPDLAFEALTSTDGPPAIQGPRDGAAAAGPLLKLIETAKADGILIGCFDDTALEEAATRADCPVLGIGQAAFFECAMKQQRFSVVTTLAVSVPVIEANIHRYGLGGYLGRVRASEVPVLELERAPKAACAPILAEARRALEEDDVDAIVLGCAGMVNVVNALRADLPCPVIDPVSSAARAMLWLSDR